MGLFGKKKNKTAGAQQAQQAPQAQLQPTSPPTKRPQSQMDAPPPYTDSTPQRASVPAPPAQNPDTRSLPQGWITQQDPRSKNWFYVHVPTTTRQWEHPADKNPFSGQNYQSYSPPGQHQPYQGYAYSQGYPQQGYYGQPQVIYAQDPRYGRERYGGGMGGFGGAGLGLGAGLLGGTALGLLAADAMTPDYDGGMGDMGGGWDGGGMDMGGMGGF